MSNVSYLKEVKKSNSNSDFHLQDISFDIEKLQAACDEVLNMKGFDTSLGIPHFAGISLNQIPGDPDSIKGSKVRGVYWTKPDSTGKEVSRDVAIEEEKYTEFVKDFEHTYFKEVYDVLTKRCASTRRIFLYPSRSCVLRKKGQNVQKTVFFRKHP